jgi:hypothetical protein
MEIPKEMRSLIFCVFCFQACDSFRVETYLIPTKMKPQWITIEYKNPKCHPLKKSSFSQEFIIPESGFICTSDSQYEGWSYRRYFLVNEKGERTPLKIGEHIWREGTMYVNEPSLDEGQPQCNVTADEFFYGSKEDLTYENPIMGDEIFLKEYHPECRNRGTGSKRMILEK